MLTRAELEGPNAKAALARLRAVGPVAWVSDLEAWVVTGYDVAVEVLRDARTFTVDDPRFSTAQVVGASMLSLDGGSHRRHRDPFVPPFRPGQVESSFGPAVRRLAADLVELIRPAGHGDLRAGLARPLAAGTIAAALDLPVDAATVLEWYTAIAGAVSAITAGEPPGSAAPAAVGHLAASAQAAAGSPGSVLGAAAASLSRAEVASNAAVVLFGGVETTEAMIANAFVHLLSSDLTGAGRDDASWLAAAVEESLRMEPAAAFVDRYATADATVGGARIRAGDLVRVSLSGANRDPAVFPDPDTFDPERSNVRAQLSFARGPHTCVAMDLARLETRTALEAAWRMLPGLRLVGPTPIRGLVFRKPDTVSVVWDEGSR